MTHSVARPPVASSKPSRKAAVAAALTMSLCIAAALPASAQRAPDDTRPGGVEVRPSAPPPPAGADMSAPPSMLFKKPTVTPPVLPAPAPVPAAAIPVTPPATPPPATVPAADKPATPPAATATPPATTPGTATPPAKVDSAKPDAGKKSAAPPPRAGATRSFRYEAPGSGAPAGAASESAPAPASGRMKGDDRLPGGVERSPSRE